MSEQAKEPDLVEEMRFLLTGQPKSHDPHYYTVPRRKLDAIMGEITRLRAERPGWRTMESAPKDVNILLLLPGNRQSVGQWDDDKYARKPRPYWNYDSVHFRTTWARSAQPVAWHPLPALSGGA